MSTCRPGRPRGDQKDSDTRARSNNPRCLQATDASLNFGLTNSTKRQRRSTGRHAPYFIPQRCAPPGAHRSLNRRLPEKGSHHRESRRCHPMVVKSRMRSLPVTRPARYATRRADGGGTGAGGTRTEGRSSGIEDQVCCRELTRTSQLFGHFDRTCRVL
jgi:hypothetical protein